jgi:nitrite reductase (NADH) large subunit
MKREPFATLARRPRLVVVGNGMAGVRTLEHLLELAPDLYDVTVFGAEPHPNYNRILLSPVLAGEQTLADIVLNDAQWYADAGVTLHLGKKVTRIDRARRIVETADGTRAEYDRLLLATGSSPVMLPLPGIELEGVLAYRDIHDTERMIAAAAAGRCAVVIGGGLLGLEAANGLRARGMDVTVVHLMPWLMERQLDETAAGMLRAALQARGIAFRLAAETEAIAGDGRVGAVRLRSGETIPAELVVMAVGIRPNVELARTAGLYCGRGIVVNDTMQTYDPRIYAVGECVAHRGVAYGLVAPLYDMARVCATHLAGFGIGRYQGSVPATRLKVTGIEVFSAGDFTGGPGTEAVALHDPEAGVYRKVVLKADRVVGAVLYGDAEGATWLSDLIAAKVDVSRIRDALAFGPEVAGRLVPPPVPEVADGAARKAA